MTRRAANEFKRNFIEQHRKDILIPEQRRIIKILSELQAGCISDKYKVRLSEICGLYNKEVQ